MNRDEQIKLIGIQVYNQKDKQKRRLLLSQLFKLIESKAFSYDVMCEIFDVLEKSGADLVLPNGHYVSVSVFCYKDLAKYLDNKDMYVKTTFGSDKISETFLSQCIDYLSRLP
jgi:hypothetical protein